MAKEILMLNIKSRDSKRAGKLHYGPRRHGHHATIRPGESITLHGEVATDDAVCERVCNEHPDCDDNIAVGLECARKNRGSWHTRAVPDKTRPYERKFKIGDIAIYDSYNLVYTGEIVAIGAKTVTIRDMRRNHQLDLAEFSMRNWQFNEVETERRNAEEMMCL